MAVRYTVATGATDWMVHGGPLRREEGLRGTATPHEGETLHASGEGAVEESRDAARANLLTMTLWRYGPRNRSLVRALKLRPALPRPPFPGFREPMKHRLHVRS